MALSCAIIGAIAQFLTSCSRLPVMSKATERITDTTIITETLRDTIIKVQQDSSLLRLLMECDSLGQVQIKQLVEWQGGTHLAPPKVTLQGNTLSIKALSEAYELQLQLKDKTITQLRSENRTEIQYIEVNRLNGWQKFIQAIGYILSIALLISLIFKLKKH